MKTTRKQLINYAIALIKEVAKSGKNINIQYQNGSVNIWFHHTDNFCECIDLYYFESLKENKQKFREAILKIRGLKL